MSRCAFAILFSSLFLPFIDTVVAAEKVVVLRTHYATRDEYRDRARGQLVREIGRQALLIAARDELGHATRDATLREVDAVPRDAVSLDWTPNSLVEWKGGIELRIRSESDSPVPTDPIKFEAKKLLTWCIYRNLAIAWEEASRGSLPQALESAGLQRRAKPRNPENSPNEEVVELLDVMDFASQYAAISAAHQAIASDGESSGWLSVLSRGYANLGTLVAHHWTSASEVFFARSLLYAQRAAVAYPEDASVQRLKPYALALLGAHNDALKLLSALPVQEAPPAWSTVIEPLCRCDYSAVQEVGKQERKIRPLTTWLGVYMQRPLGKSWSFHDRAMEAIEHSLTAYGVYSDLVTLRLSLGDQRYGAYYGPMALSQNLLKGLSPIEDLPASLAEDLPRDEEELEELVQRLGGRVASGTFTSIPRHVINSLRASEKETYQDAPREPSWSLLASLVEEEQFVLAANFGKVLHNATESSHEETIEELVNLLGNHRYVDFVHGYRLNSRERHDRAEEEFGEIRIDEPRFAMRPMFRELYHLPDPEKGLNTGYAASWEAMGTCDLRLPSQAEDRVKGIDLWHREFSQEARQEIVQTMKEISPHSPLWLRRQLKLEHDPTEKERERWVELAQKDHIASRMIGERYAQSGQIAEAIEWYERSYELEASTKTVKRLAGFYRDHGQAEKWLPTLRRFLDEEESRGLEHSNLQLHIANTYLNEERDFAKALPYAEAAAESYSARTLRAAMIANEGLAKLEQADFWAREASTSYPTGCGRDWYFFRHRNGFGDPKEARGPLEQAMANDEPLSWDNIALPILNYETEKGFDLAHAAGEESRSPFWYILSALLAQELGKEVTLQKEINTLRALSIEQYKKDYPDYHSVVMTCVELLESGECESTHEEIDARLIRIDPAGRRDYEFFLGAILQIIDREPELSDKLLRRSISRMPFNFITANLAGHYLTAKYGVARNEPIEPLGSAAAAGSRRLIAK